MDWPMLASLDVDERAAVVAAARRRTFRKGEVVFHEGDPADAMHLVAAGHLAVQVSTPDGERVTLTVLSPGDSVGELSLVRRGAPERRSATVVALDAAETRVLGVGVFQELCLSHPAVQDLVVAALADRVRDLSARLLESMYVGLDRRLYRRLLDLAEVYATGTGATVVPLTQEQLADLVGGTRPTVNQVLQRLQAQQVIELGRGRLTVLDVAALRRKAALT
jgi:CRP-like cAMP-binding protein